MANLPESSQWEEGIFQLETTTPVKGGTPVYNLEGEPVDGFSNVQAQKLANRTRFLKERVGGSPVKRVEVDYCLIEPYYIMPEDAGKTLEVLNFNIFMEILLPHNADDLDLFPVGYEVHILRTGTSRVGVFSDSIESQIKTAFPYTTELRKQFSLATLKKVNLDTWILFGDLEEQGEAPF